MPAIDTVRIQPTISVIVPARNEAACLGDCLQSLVAQSGVNFEIIVVDDHSTDRTREIAFSFSNASSQVMVRTIDAPLLPSGWTGKNNAVAAGARVARGEWLLFTDADTIHLPGSLARSLEEARSKNVSLLSYSPEQVVKTFWEKAIMPVIFAELAASYRPSQVSDPKSSAAAANGQYILIAREAYDAVGGHAAIASDLLEDVVLARAVKRSGRTISFRYGYGAVRTRMYRGFAQLREGWNKNLALLFPSPVRLAVLRVLEFVLIVAGFTSALASALRQHWAPAAATGIVAAVLYVLFLKRIRAAHFAWDVNLIALLGLPLFSYLLLRSAACHHAGTVRWKDRTYGGEPNSEAKPDFSRVSGEALGGVAEIRRTVN